jgi:hypothetical protein
LCGALQEFNVDDIKNGWSKIVHAMGVWLVCGRDGKHAGLNRGRRPFGLANWLLGDGGRAELDGGTIVAMRVVEGALPGWQVDAQDLDKVVAQNNLVVRLLIDGNGFFLRGSHDGKHKQWNAQAKKAHAVS